MKSASLSALRRFCLGLVWTAIVSIGLFESGVATAQTAPAEIVELARALKNDPDLIYEYVYNNIETLPQYGSLKGSLGALLDGKGTAFDQAELMVTLLQQGGPTASYQIGAIERTTSQLTNWLGMDNSCGSLTATLGSGGFPGTLLPATCTSVATGAQIGWAWVIVNIGGTNFVFDPATKVYNRTSGIANIASILGYSQSGPQGFITGAAATGTPTQLTGLNRANVRSNLATYANNLVQYIRSINPAAATTDIIGGKTIVPLARGTQLRQTSLSYASGTVQTASAIPGAFRTLLTLQFGSNDQNNTFTQLSGSIAFNSSDIYGHRIVISFNASLAPVLLLDGVAQLTGTGAVPSGRQLTIRSSISHPYPSPFTNVTNNDQVRVSPPSQAGTGLIYLIGTGWGQVGRGMIEKHRKLLQQNTAQYPGNPTAEPVLGESLAMLGYSWLAEVSQQQQTVDQLAGVTTMYQHAVGIVGLKAVGSSVGPYVDLPINGLSIVQRVARPIQTTFSVTPVEASGFFSEGIFQSIAESGMLEQTQPGATAASTVKLIDTTIQSSGAIFDINNSAISGDDCPYYDTTIRPQLQNNYFPADLARIDRLVGRRAAGICLSPALRVIAPANGKINVDQFTGAGYFQISQDGTAIGAIISGGLSGGIPASPVPPDIVVDNTSFSGIPSSLQSYVTTLPGVTLGDAGGFAGATQVTAEPINLVTGDYLINTTDLAVGSQSMPLGLSFQRYYDSGTKLRKGPLGYGWTHNFAITALTGSDAFEGMGINSPINGAAAIAATFVTLDILNTGAAAKPLDRIVIVSVVQRWLMDQLTTNVVAVAQPGFVENFTKLADGSYNPPPGSAAVLSFVDGAFTYTAKSRLTLSFDGVGNLSTWRDPAGATMTLSYSGAPATLASVTNNLGRTLTFAYSSGALSAVSDDSGRSVSYAYDPSGSLAGFTDAIGNTTKYVYDLPGRLSQIFYPSAPTSPFVTNTYDSLDRVKTQADANGSLWGYFLAGTRSEEINPLGMQHVIYTTPRGKTLTEIQDLQGLNQVTTNTYDPLDRLTSTTRPEGNSVSYTYDAKSNVLTATATPKPGSPLSPLVTTYTYDPIYNKPTSITDPRGLVTTMSYDAATGNLLSVVADAGAAPHFNSKTSFSYTGPGLILTATDPLGAVTLYGYDRYGNWTSTTRDHGNGRLNQTTTVRYTTAGDISSVADPNGGVATRTYDETRRLRSATTPGTPAALDGLLTLYSYDADGRVIRTQQFANGMGVILTSATYTLTGKPATVTDPNGSVTKASYDALDRPASTIDAMGRTTIYAYDALSRRTRVFNAAIPSTPLLQRSYTPNGALASLTDANSNVTNFAYDGFDRLGTSTYPGGSTETFTYDADGNVLTRKTRANQAITFTYDTLNRLATKTPPSPAPVVSYSYDLAGRLIGTSDTGVAVTVVAPPAPNTKYAMSYGYDALNRPTGVAWNPAPVAATPAASSVTFSHAYNKVNQRVGQSVSDNTWLEYPAATASTVSYTANALNQYTAVGAVSPSYDGNGNLTGDGTFTYGYDAENRLVSASGPGVTASYAYDAQGRRKSKTMNGTTTLFVTDADNREVLEYDGASGTPLRWYAYGLGSNDALNQMEVAAATRATFIPDIQGSIIAMLDSSSGAFAKAGYLPYGTSATTSGTFRYTGQRVDPETGGLYYYRARTYKPAWGRFMQADPIGYQGGINLYAYVGNDPLNLLDPLGLATAASGGLWSAITGWLGSPITSSAFPIPDAASMASCAVCVAQPLLASPSDYGQIGATVRPFTRGDALEVGLGAASIAAMGAGRILGAGAQETTALYRSVTTAELNSVRSAGAFVNPVGIETKYFATSLEGAQSYASQAASRFGEGPFATVRTTIPTNLITNEMRVSVDRGISTITVPTEMLPRLGTPQILPPR